MSELWDGWAKSLLDRAYRRPGTWVATRAADPRPEHLAYLASLGINPMGPDDKSGSGSLNARTRWARGAVRSLYYQHKWWSDAPDGGGWRDAKRAAPRSDLSLVVEVGRALPGGRQTGTLLRPGRAVRVKVTGGGRAHVRRSGSAAYTLEGAGRSDGRDRDWQ